MASIGDPGGFNSSNEHTGVRVRNSSLQRLSYQTQALNPKKPNIHHMLQAKCNIPCRYILY